MMTSCDIKHISTGEYLATGVIQFVETKALVVINSLTLIKEDLKPLTRVSIEEKNSENIFYGFIGSIDEETSTLVAIVSNDIDAEKRISIRIPMNEEVTLETVNQGVITRVKAELLNISEGGLAFKSNKKLKQGDTIVYKFNKSIHQFKINGLIVWAGKEDNAFCYGVKMTPLDGMESVTLYSYILKRVKEMSLVNIKV